MENKVPTRWFLFCGDETNEAIAASNEVVALALSTLKGPNTEFSHLLCADGKYRHLYEVPDCSFAQRLYKSQKQLGAKFQIFFSMNEGNPQRFALINRKKVTLSQARESSDKIKRKTLAKK